MRVMEAVNALPMLLLAIVLVTALRLAAGKLIICLTIVNLPGIVRLVRSQVLPLKNRNILKVQKHQAHLISG